MNTKTFVTAIVGAVVGLGLAMGTMAFADHTGHMGNYQATQATSTNQNTHGNMSGTGNMHSLGQGMMGQSTQQNAKSLDIHGQMHGKTSPQNSYGGMHQQSAATTHHAKLSQQTNNALCHGNTSTKVDAKT